MLCGRFLALSWHSLVKVFKFCVRLVLQFHILSGNLVEIKHMHI